MRTVFSYIIRKHSGLFSKYSADIRALPRSVYRMQKHPQAVLPWQAAEPSSSQKQQKIRLFRRIFLSGGDDRDRTDYLLNAIQALSQVSYTPVYFLNDRILSYRAGNVYKKFLQK